MSTQEDLQNVPIDHKRARQVWQDIRRDDQDLVFQSRRLLETLTEPSQRGEVEEIIFETLQSIQIADADIQLCNENIASVQRMRQDMDEAEGKQAAIVIAVVVGFIILVLFLIMR